MAHERVLEPVPRTEIIKDDALANSWLHRWLNNLWEKVTGTRSYSATIDPAAVAANTTAEQTFSVPGLETTDNVIVNKPSLTAGIGIVNARVSAADTLAITFINATAGSIDPPSETYEITAIKRDLL